MLQEFKHFIARGNVVDLAVGIIIGSAFTSIVNSLVGDILMPPIGWVLGGIDFSNFFLVISPLGASYPSLEAAKAAGAVTVNYGVFINAIIKFLIIAFAVFVLVKQVHNLQRRLVTQEKEPPAPTPQEKLLMEIRDVLKQQVKQI